MIDGAMPTPWAEAEVECVVKQALVEEEVTAHLQDVVALGAAAVAVAVAKTVSSAKSTVRKIIQVLNIGTGSMNPTSQVRNLLHLLPQAPTRLIQASTWTRVPHITSQVN
jgi:hypothetical protein